MEQPVALRVQQGRADTAALRIRVIRLGLRLLFRLLFRVRVEGLHHVPDRAALLAANHLGWADPFLILLFLPVEPRIYVLGEDDVATRSAWRTRVIDFCRIMVPLDHDRPRQALRAVADVLHRGGSLVVFPEGRLGTCEGTLQPLQPGVARLSLQTGVPVVPIGLTGTSRLWVRRTLTVRIGAPLDPAAFTADNARSRAADMTAVLTRDISALLPGDGPLPRRRPLEGRLTRLL